jgi:hypothetical protein
MGAGSPAWVKVLVLSFAALLMTALTRSLDHAEIHHDRTAAQA